MACAVQPPGCGCTLVANVCAQVARCRVLHLNGYDLQRRDVRNERYTARPPSPRAPSDATLARTNGFDTPSHAQCSLTPRTQPCRLVRDTFEDARQDEPAIIVIDCVDALNPESPTTRRTFTELAVQMQGRDPQPVVIGLTSRPWKMNPYMRRR